MLYAESLVESHAKPCLIHKITWRVMPAGCSYGCQGVSVALNSVWMGLIPLSQGGEVVDDDRGGVVGRGGA